MEVHGRANIDLASLTGHHKNQPSTIKPLKTAKSDRRATHNAPRTAVGPKYTPSATPGFAPPKPKPRGAGPRT